MLFLVANAGLPMLMVHAPWLVILFVPIVAVESLVISRRVRVALGKVLLPTTIANAVSTLLGVPLTWFFLVLVEQATVGGGVHGLDSPLGRFQSAVLQAPWLVPHEDDFYWLVPTATLVLLPCYFLVSVLVERFVLRRKLPAIPGRSVDAATWLANAASYGLIAVTVVLILVFELNRH